tara:strand:- start:693 stop:1121 length:429 start_codon:yes stop_codon:yes gene_type:complete
VRFKEDLKQSIFFGDARDDVDTPFIPVNNPVKFSECNRKELIGSFLPIKDACKVIVEIGVHRNGQESSTHCFLNNKKRETVYLGVDLDDKSFLNNEENNVHTIICDSSNYDLIVSRLNDIGVNHIDYLFIDGWHSINQVCAD